MKALQLTDQGDDTIILNEIDKPEPNANEVLVQVKAAALNHRDQWCREGKYPALKVGVTLGSDGAGIVVGLGKNVSNNWLNQEVIINPNIDWGDNPLVQSANYHILGMPSDGTFAEYTHIKKNGSKVTPGEVIKKGQHIGYSGNVGWSTGPHLHFIVFLQRFNDRETLPTKFLVGNGKQFLELEERKRYIKSY